MNPIDKDDAVVSAVLAVVCLLAWVGACALWEASSPTPRASAAMASAAETWKW